MPYREQTPNGCPAACVGKVDLPLAYLYSDRKIFVQTDKNLVYKGEITTVLAPGHREKLQIVSILPEKLKNGL